MRWSRSSTPRPWRFTHDKHHKAYVDKLNEAIAKAPEVAGKSPEETFEKISPP